MEVWYKGFINLDGITKLDEMCLIGELLKRSSKDNMCVSASYTYTFQEFGTTRAQPSCFKKCLRFTLIQFRVRPSVVAFYLHASFCLVIQMHAVNIEIT